MSKFNCWVKIEIGSQIIPIPYDIFRIEIQTRDGVIEKGHPLSFDFFHENLFPLPTDILKWRPCD
jgi:hypothetical protein